MAALIKEEYFRAAPAVLRVPDAPAPATDEDRAAVWKWILRKRRAKTVEGTWARGLEQLAGRLRPEAWPCLRAELFNPPALFQVAARFDPDEDAEDYCGNEVSRGEVKTMPRQWRWREQTECFESRPRKRVKAPDRERSSPCLAPLGSVELCWECDVSLCIRCAKDHVCRKTVN